MNNPYKNTFELAKKINNYSLIFLYLSAIIIFLDFLIKSYFNQYLQICDVLIKVNCFIIIIYAVLSFLSEYVFFNASSQRRIDFIDNSFETSYSDTKSSNYYTNDNIRSGIYKMAVNGFENSLFTYHIAKKMVLPLCIKNSLFIILFLSFAVFGFNNGFILLIQLTLPILLFQQAIRHTLFVHRIKHVYLDYKKLFNNMKGDIDYSSKIPEIIINVFEYETTLTFGAMQLNSKIYNELNPILSQKWMDIKSDLGIK
jgi:hypothetical protein